MKARTRNILIGFFALLGVLIIVVAQNAPASETAPTAIPDDPDSTSAFILTSERIRLSVTHIQFLPEIGGQTPQRDTYAVFWGALTNMTDERQCVFANDVRLWLDGDADYAPRNEAMATLRDTYYPDYNYISAYSGHCLEPEETEPTFAVFDTRLGAESAELAFFGEREAIPDQWPTTAAQGLIVAFVDIELTATPSPTLTPDPTATFTQTMPPEPTTPQPFTATTEPTIPAPLPATWTPRPTDANTAALRAAYEALPAVESVEMVYASRSDDGAWVVSAEATVIGGAITTETADAMRQATYAALFSARVSFSVILNDGINIPIDYVWDNGDDEWIITPLSLLATALAQTAEATSPAAPSPSSAAQPPAAATAPAPVSVPRPGNCSTAVAMGLTAEQAAQWDHLDRDGDGVACYGD